MKIKLEIKELNLETHVATLDLDDPHDRKLFGPFFDLDRESVARQGDDAPPIGWARGILVPGAEEDPAFFELLRDQDRLEFAGLERQSEYVWDTFVVTSGGVSYIYEKKDAALEGAS